jgi:hypothetical protein
MKGDKDKATKTEYFFPVYGGEAKVILASSREEAEKLFTDGEKPEALKDKLTKEYE